VLRLNGDVYVEIAHDNTATIQALVIVMVAALLNALGRAIISDYPLQTLLSLVPGALVGWMLLAGAIYILAGVLQGNPVSYIGMLRVVGYAVAPLMLTAIPYIGWIFWVWVLANLFVAVRSVYDMESPRVFLTVAVGIIFAFAGWALLGVFAGIIIEAVG
jgi:hypothetical protein